MNYPTVAPCQTLSLNDWVTPEAARIFINAVEELQKIGFKPTLSLFLDSKPEPKPEPKAEATDVAYPFVEKVRGDFRIKD